MEQACNRVLGKDMYFEGGRLSRHGRRRRCNRSSRGSRRWIELGSGEEAGQIEGEVVRGDRGGVVRPVRGSRSRGSISDGRGRNSRCRRRGAQSTTSAESAEGEKVKAHEQE